MIQKDMNPATTVVRPSKIKIHAQPGFPPTPSIFEIAAFGKNKVNVNETSEEGIDPTYSK